MSAGTSQGGALPPVGPIDRAITSGTFTLDGETFEVDNNVWVVGDDRSCIVLDAPHSVPDILRVVGDRELRAIVCTHAHDDHVRVAPELRAATGAPIWLHPAAVSYTHLDVYKRQPMASAPTSPSH